ncbi:MAG: TldD/PmbA family protein [Candidatus Heimdallarchaeum endolithica]|uniref:TldD/PmbA family protein n=1 Tax=Candidatus Heimdallarchaeum endolithica TaxID=2876572 RepID=A0A9Y1BSC8_9ARCH|nr:MAG: TldD/PmbA family protein [Candidatus Heimdallarchaeum endolithica]
MEDIINFALKKAESKNVNFAEVRIFGYDSEVIALRNSEIDQIGRAYNTGYGVRVIKNGAWGFASSADISKETIDEVVNNAIKEAEATSKVIKRPVELSEEPIIKDHYKTPFKIDPFEVDFEEKLEILKKADEIIAEKGDVIKVRQTNMSFYKVYLNYGNTDGTRIEQEELFTGAGVSATAIANDNQRREIKLYEMRGFEYIDMYNFEEKAEKVAQEAIVLATEAVAPKQQKTAFILEPFQLGLTIHESCGHPTELDRVLGWEADFAGTSFLTLEKLGKNYQYGSEKVNLVNDPTIPYVLGHEKYDHEGVETKRFYVVKNGIFNDYQTDRQTAKIIGKEHSNGNARIARYNRVPLVRMSNLYLEADSEGPKDIDELIAETKEGIYGINWKSHSIDDKRTNFQFSVQLAYEIKNGELGRPLKNTIYQAVTPEFWGGLDLMTKEWRIEGLGPSCGKGAPHTQAMWVSHGGPYARFQGVNIFSG